MSYISTAACPHHWRLLGIKVHGNIDAYNIFKHKLAKANKYGTILIYVLKYSRGYRLTSITQGLSLSHLLWTANTEKQTESWFTLPLASVSSDEMSAVQLPWLCSSVALTAPHALQALSSLMVETHSCLKSLPCLAFLIGRGPGLKGDISEKGGIPQSELAGSAVPWQREEDFKRAFASRVPQGWGPPTESITSKGELCRSWVATLQSLRWCSVALQTLPVPAGGFYWLTGSPWRMREKPSGPDTNQTELEVQLKRQAQSIADALSHLVSSPPLGAFLGLYWTNVRILLIC